MKTNGFFICPLGGDCEKQKADQNDTRGKKEIKEQKGSEERNKLRKEIKGKGKKRIKKKNGGKRKTF